MNELKTCFKRVDYDLAGLLHYIDLGDIGLPDIQRPFVWSNAKVRDLFDSMYRGFPVGYLLFWANANGNGIKSIGLGQKAHTVPSLLIVDGQQRLTSLYAVFRGIPVLDEEYRERKIEIAFRPKDGTFAVCDAAIRKDLEYIPDISVIWSSGYSSFKLVSEFLKRLEEKQKLSDAEREHISHNLDKLFDLQKFPFTALEIAPSVDDEQVADIFVRINNQGVKLNQADFILTLMSVFCEDSRKELEAFSRASRIPPKQGDKASPFNHFLTPSPDQLLRVSVAIGFYRGRLKSVYPILRGRDIDTGAFTPERRDEQFATLRDAQDKVLNLTNWHEFLKCLVGAGFRSGNLVSSENSLLYSYAFYLLGRTRFKVPEHILQRLIGRWFFAATLLGRYTSSPESIMDSDLNRVKDLSDADAFVSSLERIIADTLTSDFWTITLPNALESSSARSPELFAFYAAQNKLGAPVLFSKKRVSDLLDPTIKTKKLALERHHLFPKAHLREQGITDLKQINQCANFAFLEWLDNNGINDTPPSSYVPEMRGRFSDEEWQEMCSHHALPHGWENMLYSEFLVERRKLMAGIIRKGFEALE